MPLATTGGDDIASCVVALTDPHQESSARPVTDLCLDPSQDAGSIDRSDLSTPTPLDALRLLWHQRSADRQKAGLLPEFM
jgi:hypothetical protein